ncbi:DNA-binding protein [Segetibacter sp. 3557_3]|uniref:helix-turn-helix domain-containing protein n=1 Tax=Segetibacter sp. 3557_3 TaxID=2547429 RepID=UPI001058C5FD|nr:helix-turn-helix domain-containing protein [Segetibacter sp. 3557_3]TDH23978.1 DNA-binding protein [Segetibacter sp. 3557_3]
MDALTFDQLPQAVRQLYDKLTTIEQLLREETSSSEKEDELLTITEAAKFLNLSIPTLYGKVSRREIPVNKQGKRLYFYKSELIEWIKQGRKKTTAEVREETDLFLASRKKR